jgi:hypothetical protein
VLVPARAVRPGARSLRSGAPARRPWTRVHATSWGARRSVRAARQSAERDNTDSESLRAQLRSNRLCGWTRTAGPPPESHCVLSQATGSGGGSLCVSLIHRRLLSLLFSVRNMVNESGSCVTDAGSRRSPGGTLVSGTRRRSPAMCSDDSASHRSAGSADETSGLAARQRGRATGRRSPV